MAYILAKLLTESCLITIRTYISAMGGVNPVIYKKIPWVISLKAGIGSTDDRKLLQEPWKVNGE
jgi:hypothetical protein